MTIMFSDSCILDFFCVMLMILQYFAVPDIDLKKTYLLAFNFLGSKHREMILAEEGKN
jgi:hypothetical protein